MSWEKRFYEDIMPEIEDYTEQETTSFTSGDIAERLEDYTPQKVGKTLKYMTDNGESNHIIMTGNNPKTWEAILLEGTAWERLGYELEVEPQTKDKEDIAEEVLEENPEKEKEGLYAKFIDSLREQGQFNNTAGSIREIRSKIEQERPETDREILNLTPQEYGKLRKNVDEVYEGLQEVKKRRSELFRTEHVKTHVEDVRASEVGVVLSGLAAAGLLEPYEDRKGYMPDSIDLEKVQEFRRTVKNTESIEDLGDILDFDEKM
jgi:hypothetical protein